MKICRYTDIDIHILIEMNMHTDIDALHACGAPRDFLWALVWIAAIGPHFVDGLYWCYNGLIRILN